MSDRKDAFRRAAMDSLIRANNLALTDSLLNDECWPKNAERRKTAISRLAEIADEIASALCSEEETNHVVGLQWRKAAIVSYVKSDGVALEQVEPAVTIRRGHKVRVVAPGGAIRGEFSVGECTHSRSHAQAWVQATSQIPIATVPCDVIEVLTHV